MDIPELRSEITSFLDIPHFYACALVSRKWNYYFTPLLYNAINKKNEISTSIQRYAVFALTLTARLENPIIGILSESTTNLREIDALGSTHQSKFLPRDWITLCQRNPKLVKATLRLMRPPIMLSFIEHCPNLTQLSILGHDFSNWMVTDKNYGSMMWRICQQLTHLTLTFSQTATPKGQLAAPPVEGLPSLRHLYMGSASSSVHDQARLIGACKNLETLTWDLSLTREDARNLIPVARTLFATLPDLCELTLLMPINRRPIEGGVYEFIDLLPCLKAFNSVNYLIISNPARIVKGPLSKHFNTLERLDLSGWQGMESSGNQIILTSCPNLRTFCSTVYKVSSKNNENNMDMRLEGKRFGPLGWVCPRLNDLRIRYMEGEPEDNRRMFDQLCLLRELDTILVRGLVPSRICWDNEEASRTWPWSGLDHKEIAKLPWLRKIWPHLRFLCTYSKGDMEQPEE
jgi:hypothetical protein